MTPMYDRVEIENSHNPHISIALRHLGLVGLRVRADLVELTFVIGVVSLISGDAVDNWLSASTGSLFWLSVTTG